MKERMEIYKKILQKTPCMYTVAEAMGEGGLPQQMTAFVFSPLVISFCVWALQEAEKKGLKRLYFLSRDGYQFYRCAKRLSEAMKSPVEVRYLFVSRYSLRIPCFFLLGEEALSYICLRGMEVSFLDLMERAGLDAKEAEQTAKEIGYEKKLQEPIPLTKIPDFREELKNSPFFMGRMEEISRQAFCSAVGYLTQEGLLDSVSWGIVDSGWTGTTQQVLGQLLDAAVQEKNLRSSQNVRPSFHGFYFGLFDLPSGADASLYHTWYFSWKGNLKRKSEFSNSLFEAVFGAPHGMVTGYEPVECRQEETPGFVPHLLARQGLQSEEMERQTAGILQFTDRWIRQGCRKNSKNQGKIPWEQMVLSPAQLQKLLRLFMGRPTLAEAECYGSYQFSDDVTERKTKPMALPLTEEELKGGHIAEKFVRLYGKKDLPVKESAWYEGSAALYSSRAADHQRHYRRYKKLIYIRKGWERKLRK